MSLISLFIGQNWMILATPDTFFVSLASVLKPPSHRAGGDARLGRLLAQYVKSSSSSSFVFFSLTVKNLG